MPSTFQTLLQQGFFQKHIKAKFLNKSLPVLPHTSAFLKRQSQVVPFTKQQADATAAITSSLSKEDLQMAYSLFHTVHARQDAFGLSAVQVSYLRRMFLGIEKLNIVQQTDPKTNEVYPVVEGVEYEIFINPEIVSTSKEEERDVEGCLSVAGLFAIVSRPKTVAVRYTDVLGQTQEKEFSGVPARVFLHEYDHLEGILMLDRVKNAKTDTFKEDDYVKFVNPETGELREQYKFI